MVSRTKLRTWLNPAKCVITEIPSIVKPVGTAFLEFLQSPKTRLWQQQRDGERGRSRAGWRDGELRLASPSAQPCETAALHLASVSSGGRSESHTSCPAL